MGFINLLKNVFSVSSQNKEVSSRNKYNVIYNDSPFPDNLNFYRYECSAIFAETNRKRTRKIEAFSEAEALEQMRSEGFVDPITIKRIPFDPPTEPQITACKQHHTEIPTKACKLDMSYIIDRSIENDSIANPELLQFATEMKIATSYYTGKRTLYCNIFNALDLRDKIAFFIFCIYRFLTKDRCGNLNRSQFKDIFYNFSDVMIENQSFVKSMNRYSGDQLRYFGEYNIGKDTYCYGGSQNTMAYKSAVQYLRKQHLL